MLITSRREEPWLEDCNYKRLALSGLSGQDVEEFAAKILQRVGVDRAQLPEEYLKLLKLLGGHPLSLRVILPHLKAQSPIEIMEALRLGFDTFQGAEEEGRDKSLYVSLDYSFAKLSDRARQHLPFLALFSERVVVDLLDAFSASPTDKYGQSYHAVFGENLQKHDWLSLLNEATAAGILEHLGKAIYKIHPALPWYLRQQLSKHYAAKEVSELEKKLLVFYARLAERFRKRLVGDTELATLFLRVEEPNLLQNLRLAQQKEDWLNALLILQAVGTVYQRLDRRSEFKSLRQRVLNQIGIHLAQAKAKGQNAFKLWRFLRYVDANDAAQDTDWETAGSIYQNILEELNTTNDPSEKINIACCYLGLGIVAPGQRQLDKAFICYQKAQQIFEDKEDFDNAAIVYHQLGMLFQQQGWLADAIAYYQEAVKIREETRDWYGVATDYNNLGLVAKQLGLLDEAFIYHQKSGEILEIVGDFSQAADSYHNLGILAQEKGHFEEAINNYHKALKIYENLGNFYKYSYQCHKLGEISREQEDFDSAIAYFQKAFIGTSTANDWRKASLALVAWGETLEAQENWTDALKIYIKALGIDLEHNQEWVSSDVKGMGRMLKVLGESPFQAIWREVTGEECSEEWLSAFRTANEAEEE